MESYLGDGLYASIEGNTLKLRAPRLEGDHIVYLEDAVFLALIRYIRETNPWPYVNLSKCLTSQ
jgi:hypothetical protein